MEEEDDARLLAHHHDDHRHAHRHDGNGDEYENRTTDAEAGGYVMEASVDEFGSGERAHIEGDTGYQFANSRQIFGTLECTVPSLASMLGRPDHPNNRVSLAMCLSCLLVVFFGSRISACCGLGLSADDLGLAGEAPVLFSLDGWCAHIYIHALLLLVLNVV